MKSQTILATLMTGVMCQFATQISRAQGGSDTAPSTEIKADAPKRNPLEVIQEKLKKEVGAKLTEAGASYDELQVTVAINRDSATPFRVSYSGLRNFTGADGTTPAATGSFVMEYKGGGQWKGALAGIEFAAQVGTRDNIDLPFVDDPQVLGEWESVDFVSDISSFNPAQASWEGKLFLKGLTFLENGKTGKPWWTWTKGTVMHSGDQTVSHYEIRDVNGTSYLFFEWKSGDVTIAGMKPWYYVMKQKAAKSAP